MNDYVGRERLQGACVVAHGDTAGAIAPRFTDVVSDQVRIDVDRADEFEVPLAVRQSCRGKSDGSEAKTHDT